MKQAFAVIMLISIRFLNYFYGSEVSYLSEWLLADLLRFI